MTGGRPWTILQHVAYEGPGAIADALRSGGHPYRVVRLDHAEPVPEVATTADMAGLIVMGGPMSVHDDAVYPWLRPERALMKAAVDHGLPVLGVCLGAQQLAAALGGTVSAGPTVEVGVGEVRLTPEARRRDGVFGPAATPLACMHWHGDTFSLPEGSVLLASSDDYPHQAFRFAGRAYGLQFHVEVTSSLAGQWAAHLPPGVLIRAPDVAQIARSGVGLVQRFLALADDI